MGDKENQMIQLKQMLNETITAANEKLRRDLRVELVEDLTKKIEETIANKLSEIQCTLAPLKEDVENLKKTANDAYEFSTANTDKISSIELRLKELEDSCASVSTTQTKHNEDHVGYKKDIDSMKKVIDDQINRSMRGNLIFFGLEEVENEMYSSKDIVSKFIFDRLYEETENITIQEIRATIVRAHRSKFRPDRNGPRPIYAKFYRDDAAATYLKRSIQKKVSNNNDGVRVKQQFTQELQVRMDKALKVRRELLEKKTITKGYVEYPATLKGIFANSPTDGYKVIQTF